jgi:hypothetical protein
MYIWIHDSNVCPFEVVGSVIETDKIEFVNENKELFFSRVRWLVGL